MIAPDIWRFRLEGQGYFVDGIELYARKLNNKLILVGEIQNGFEDIWWILDSLGWPKTQAVCSLCRFTEVSVIGSHCPPCQSQIDDENRGESAREAAEERSL